VAVEIDVQQAARAGIASRLSETTTAPPTAERITERLAANPPLADGKLDEAALHRQVDVAVAEEADYLAAVGVGQVRGFGGGPAPSGAYARLTALRGGYLAGAVDGHDQRLDIISAQLDVVIALLAQGAGPAPKEEG
jgi:hypothetical protein